MPDLINCPSCNRQLSLPETMRGKAVKCPQCGNVFTAGGGAAPPPPPAEAGGGELPPHLRRAVEEGMRAGFEEGIRGAVRGGVDDAFARHRSGVLPARGGTIMTMGILSIVFAICCPLVGAILGVIALVMGNGDLTKIRAGEMDPAGEGSTNGGRICGIIGIALSVVMLCVNIIIAIAQQQ